MPETSYSPQSLTIQKELACHVDKCIECGLCQKECSFLQKNGSPKAIAASFSLDTPGLAFECSLCGLCANSCPPKIGLNPAALFLAMRQEAVAVGIEDFSAYNTILGYEKRGASRHYSYYALPKNCDTILFPGCALPGTRPGRVKSLFDHLQISE